MRVRRVIGGVWRQRARGAIAAVSWIFLLICCGLITQARGWTEDDFENRPLIAYPMPGSHDDIVGQLQNYTIQKGDTLLDIGRWYGLSAKEISDANGHIDWWGPPVGKQIVLPTEHILPGGERRGIILNIPEMRLYYYPVGGRGRHKGKVVKAVFSGAAAVYTFPVGLGRFDWKTPAGKFTVRGKTRNPTWVVPNDIYQEHLERDGEAEHVVPGGRDDNPLGLYRLELTLPEYALHGTDVPWGVGMTVSHGCVRLYPEDIKRLFNKVRIGTPGAFVYEPVKFGWRADALYVEVHDDLYGRYPGLWNHAAKEARRQGLTDQIDYRKLQQAVEGKSGIPTYIGLGAEPDAALDTAEAPLSTTPESIGAASTASDAGSAASTASEPASAPIPSTVEATPSREPAPGRAADSPKAELGASRAIDSTSGDGLADIPSDENRGVDQNAGKGLPPTDVIEEPDSADKTPPHP